MGHSNGEITAPVSTDDVVAVLGETTHNIPLLCRSDKINPASKYKPIRGFSYEELTEEQRRGTTEDYVNGILFGVRGVSNSTILGFKTNPHELDYSYAGKPRKWIDWGRITDFIGYDHYAKFLPIGSVETWIYYDTQVPEVQVDFDMRDGANGCVAPDGFTGIAVDSLIKILEGSTYSLAGFYPCACIRVDGNDYVRALSAPSSEQQTPIPGGDDVVFNPGTMTTNGAVAGGAWRAQGWHINLKGLDTKARVTFTDGMKLKVSIIFLPKIQEGSLDLTQWTELNSIGAVVNMRAYGCPGAVNVETELRRLYKPGLMVYEPYLRSIDNGTRWKFSVRVGKAESWSKGTYKVEVTITSKGDVMNSETASGTYTFEEEGTYTPAPNGINMLFIMDFPAVYFERPAGEYSYHWKVTFNNQVTNSGNGSFTIT